MTTVDRFRLVTWSSNWTGAHADVANKEVSREPGVSLQVSIDKAASHCKTELSLKTFDSLEIVEKACPIAKVVGQEAFYSSQFVFEP